MEGVGLIVNIFRPEGTEGVVELFTGIYGDSYPAKIVYNPDQPVRAFKNRDQIPIVVRIPDSSIVGYTSLFRVVPDEGVHEKGKSTSGQLSTLPMFITIIPKPYIVHTPEMHKEYLGYIYEGLDGRRSFSLSKDNPPHFLQTRIDTEIFDFAQVSCVTIHETGSNFVRIFISEEQRILSRNVEIIQVWLKLSWPWIDRISGLLKNNPYFFGGVFPQGFGKDGFFMQKNISQPN